MSSSQIESPVSVATSVSVTDDALIVVLADGRTVSVPLDWYPRLLGGSANERAEWRLIDGGSGIHWPSLDEDISVAGLLSGRRSGESAASLESWRNDRSQSR